MSKTLKIYLKDFPKLTGDTVGVLTEYDGGILEFSCNKNVTDAKHARVKAVRKPAARKATVRKIAYNEDTKCGSCGVKPSELSPPGIFCTECRHIKSVEIHENYQKWKKEHGLPTETREEELARIQNENTLDEARKQKLLVGA